MTNPYQQAQPEEYSLGEALRIIAERTPFRTEDEQNAVYAAIDKHILNENAPEVPDEAPQEPAKPDDE